MPSSVRLLRRVVVTLVGTLICAAGVVLLVAPGPGVLVLALGFFVLGLEYEWAQRRFVTARRAAADLADRAVARPASTVLSVLGCLGLVVAGLVWALVPSLPGSSWWTGGSLAVGGLIALGTVGYSFVQGRARRTQQPERSPR